MQGYGHEMPGARNARDRQKDVATNPPQVSAQATGRARAMCLAGAAYLDGVSRQVGSSTSLPCGDPSWEDMPNDPSWRCLSSFPRGPRVGCLRYGRGPDAWTDADVPLMHMPLMHMPPLRPMHVGSQTHRLPDTHASLPCVFPAGHIFPGRRNTHHDNGLVRRRAVFRRRSPGPLPR